MAVHLITYLKEQFTPGVVDKLSGTLNESPANTLKAINGAIPTLLGGLTRRIQATGGASATISLLDKGDYSNTPLEISQTLDHQPDISGVVAAGQDFLTYIFDEQQTHVNELISVYSGVKPQSVQTILSLTATSLVGVLGRQEQEKGLTSESLETLLLGQATEFRKTLPDGLESIESLLGFNDLQTPEGPQTEVQGADDFSSNVVNPNIPKSAEGDRRKENVRWLSWVFVAMAVLVLGIIIQKCSQNQNSVDGVSTDSTARVESNEVEDTSAATRKSIEEANGQTTDSTVPDPLGIRDSTKNPR